MHNEEQNVDITYRKGRGALENPSGRFETLRLEVTEDDDSSFEAFDEQRPQKTETFPDTSRSVIALNQSPDIPFDQSINMYRGCEHGCIYCYARPTHNFLGLSSGLDFETKIFVKRDAAELLVKTLRSPHYKCRTIALGTNTDPYQPIERSLRITRNILEVLSRCGHPASIVTKSSLVLRDIDILGELAANRLVSVFVSITTLQGELARKLEPRTSAPRMRLQAVRELASRGIETGILLAPIIPALNGHEIETILDRCAEAGASSASYTILRLPYDLKELFSHWLSEHYPDRKKHVLNLIRQTRSGALNDANFHSRMVGDGPYASMIEQRFNIARRRLGLSSRAVPPRCDLFDPSLLNNQLSLGF